MDSLKPPAAPTPTPVPLGGRASLSSEISGRKKVTLAPGHSLMDWIRLGRTQGDLSTVGPNKKRLTLADLAVHNKPDDIWMALRGKVYNITPYMSYHPGGADELMRAAGKDGTELFDEIHNWVNLESMLEKCLVGYLVDIQRPVLPSARDPEPRESFPSLTSVLSWWRKKENIRYDWFQKKEFITVVVYTKWEGLTRELVTTEVSDEEITIHTHIQEFSYFVNFKPCYPVLEWPKVTVHKGKVEVQFEKATTDRTWPMLGQSLPKDREYVKTKSLAPRYREWTVTSNTPVTSNTVLLRLKAPQGYSTITPLGYHIHIITDISGMQIGRSYTVISPSLINPKCDQDQNEGHAIHLMIKCYPDGVLSPWATSVKPGDTMMVSNYDGSFDPKILDKITSLTIFAAGTGITSFIRIISHVLNDMPGAMFPVTLVFFNRTINDILWKDQLDTLASKNSRFQVVNVLSQEPDNSVWTGLRGRVNASHVKNYVPAPSSTSFPYLCICGQWAFNDSVQSIARCQGLKDEHIRVFSS